MAPDVDARRSRTDPFSPLTSEHLAVSDGHEIYVESVGREAGIPAVYLHGGPGSGCQPDHRRPDLQRHRVMSPLPGSLNQRQILGRSTGEDASDLGGVEPV